MICFTYASPLLTEQFVSLRAKHRISYLQQMIFYAKTEALKRQLPIILCPIGGNGCGNDWSNGWQIYVDSNHDRKKHPSEPQLMVNDALAPNERLFWRGARLEAFVGVDSHGMLLDAARGAFFYCVIGLPAIAHKLVINQLGRIRNVNVNNTHEAIDSMDCERGNHE